MTYLLDILSSDGFLFADDTKILREILRKEDSVALQSDINKLEEWTKKWLLKFNTIKCHVLTLGKLENIRYV